jgi:hypothetical protein
MPATHPSVPGAITAPTKRLPRGYKYGVTRYADVILVDAFPTHWKDLTDALDALVLSRAQLDKGGGPRTTISAQWDSSLQARGWAERGIDIQKLVDGSPVMAVRGHRIDMFKAGSAHDPYPGIGCEMEWNNKDPFFDRDLNNFAALHREGVLAVGVIITRGPHLQAEARKKITGGKTKYGASTTWWDKLTPRINLGGGGECPLLLIGIEPERIPDL